MAAFAQVLLGGEHAAGAHVERAMRVRLRVPGQLWAAGYHTSHRQARGACANVTTTSKQQHSRQGWSWMCSWNVRPWTESM
jgi:hypothetical protein